MCMTGWNGRHCTLSGCPGNCGGKGTCEATSEGTWYCSCRNGWDGPDCSAMLETQCNDQTDNDNGKWLDDKKYIKKVSFFQALRRSSVVCENARA